MADIKYSKEHQWILVDGEIGTVGITSFACDQLDDIVYVEIPDIGREFSKNDEVAVIESSKAASEIYTPVSEQIVKVNSALEDTPILVNQDPMNAGWVFKINISDVSDLHDLL